MGKGEDVPELLGRVEAIEMPVYGRAKVIVNERTGTVVIGGKVVLQPVSILHGGLTVNIVSEFEVSQPNAFSRTGTTEGGAADEGGGEGQAGEPDRAETGGYGG